VQEGLQLMKDAPRYAVYEVTQIDAERAAPESSSVDGYDCRTNELTL
jgi:hypothetical protein